MAREEHEREELLREATAYTERIELELRPDNRIVFVGFRRDGCASFYFGAEPVYHFNTRGELRRAHAGGLIVKAEHGGLATLDRRRAGGEVQLVRQDLDPQEIQGFLQRVGEDLLLLRRAIEADEVRVTGQVPEDADVLGRVRTWLTSLDRIVAAQTPGVG